MNSNPTVDLTAPSSGATAGSAIWVDKRSSSTDSIDLIGHSSMTINGAVYAPNAETACSGTSTATYCSRLIGRTKSLSRTPDSAHTCSSFGTSEPLITSIAVVDNQRWFT